MLTSIAGRSVIVTGASKGIGKGIAKVFARNGGKVLVVSRHLDEAEACAEELRRAGGTAKGHAADVTKMGDMQVMADAAVAAHGGIDISVRQCRHFPADQDRGAVARGLGLRHGDEFERHLPADQGLPAATSRNRTRAAS